MLTNKKKSYIIGTGWWTDNSGFHVGSNKESSPKTRKTPFFDLWYNNVKKYTSPEKIVVVDSNSPFKPNILNKDLEFISLNKNFGHGVEANKKLILPGWDRGVNLSAAYAFYCDVDYFVYIEQDVLFYGNKIIEYAISKMTKPMMVGDGKGTPQHLQQSFFIIKHDFILEFLSKASIPENNSSEQKYFERFKGQYDFLPFGFGRIRPINFDTDYFYAQHWTEPELQKIIFKIK